MEKKESDKQEHNNDSKANQEGEGKKQHNCKRARWPTTLQKTLASNDRNRSRMQSKDNVMKRTCNAGRQCQMMRMAIKVDGKKGNATCCETCPWVCHNACLFQWKKKVYCIQCYKMVVAEEYNTTTTFEEIFEARKNLPWWTKRKHEGEPTPVLDTIKQYIDQYLKSAGYQMTSSEFFEWKNMIDDLNKHEDMGTRKDKISNITRNGKFDRKNLLKGHKGRKHCTTISHAKSTIKPAKSTSRL